MTANRAVARKDLQWGVRWVLLACLSAGCFVDRKTSDFTCAQSSECETGRTCVDGYCVLDSCPTACTSAGGTCKNPTTCRFSCNTQSACPDAIDCPPGMACEVACGGNNACADDIDCGQATSCTVTCSATNTCAGRIDCGDGRCDVKCSGTGSCASRVACNDACACDVTCSGTGACDTGATCHTGTSCSSGMNCNSTSTACNTCN